MIFIFRVAAINNNQLKHSVFTSSKNVPFCIRYSMYYQVIGKPLQSL